MRKTVYSFIVLIGLLQIIGFITGIRPLRSLGMATASSPLPIVFTDVKGLETFASDFFILYSDVDGKTHEVQITPEIYSRLKGPYNRRNIFGAAIAYGPVIKEEIWRSVLFHGLCKKVLVREMGLPDSASNFSIRIKSKTAGRNQEYFLKPECLK